MTTINKVLLALLALTIVGAIGFIIYQQHQMSVMQQQLNTSLVAQQALLNGITRSSSQYVTAAQFDAFAQQNNVNLATIQKDVEALNSTITGMNQVTVTSQGQNQTGLASTSTQPTPNPTPPPTVSCNGQQIPCPNTDPYGYVKNTQDFGLVEQFSATAQTGGSGTGLPSGTPTPSPTAVPIGSVAFNASSATPWSVNVFPRSYDVTNVLATDQNGKQTVYNQFAITVNNQSYKVPIGTAKFVQQYPSPSFSFWNPHLFLTADAGAELSTFPAKGEFIAGGRLGIMSYGTTKTSPDWSFLQIGAGYGTVSDKLQLMVSPVQYNIGKAVLPSFMNNTYIGPTMSVGVNGNITVGAGLSVGL
jgi:hypothetical protein